MVGPIGPPGFNGSQGPAGSSGSVGPPGPKGAGGFSSCQYKVVTETLTPGYSVTTVGLTEPNVSMFTGKLRSMSVLNTHFLNCHRKTVSKI